MRQAKVKRKRENKPHHRPDQPPEGPVDGVLHGLDEIMPGFGELVKGLENSEPFRQRLKAANIESERLMGKAPPLTRAGETRRSIIPPRTNMKASRTTLEPESSVPAHQRDMITEIFDEGENLIIIAELPGAVEKDIEIDIQGNRLGLLARNQDRQYQKNITLPCAVKEKPSYSYKNGILKIILVKEPKQV
jgi:HSP20 family protein